MAKATGKTWEEKAGPVVTSLVKDLALKDFQAAGLVGQFGVESNEFRSLHEIGQPEGQGGYGWAQWTGTRRRAFLAWCKEHNVQWQSYEANYDYLVSELTHGYKSFLNALRRTESIEEATHLAHREYETPQEVIDGTETSYPKRLSYAIRALNGAVPDEPDIPPDTPPDPVSDHADLDDALLAQANITRIIQRQLGLTVDGDYGKSTRDAVQKYLKER